MDVRPQYMSAVRRLRESRYRHTLSWSVAVAVALHAALVPMIAPLRERIPLVRRSGYAGPIRLLPEISILREPGEVRSDFESFSGELAGSAFEMVDMRIIDEETPETRQSEAVVEELDLTLGDDLRNMLESSLPQPTSSEIVIEHMVEPVYPSSAIAAGIEGVAIFGIQVADTGAVLRAWLIDSEVTGECNLEAQRALLQWRFRPYLVNGRPAPFLKYYRIRFHFRDELHDTARVGG